MKSKIFCFNKTLFRKNVTLYWPIWGVYLLGLLVMPVRLWISFAEEARNVYENSSSFLSAGSAAWKYYYLSDAFAMETYIVFTFVMAIITAMALFSFLYSFRACQMMHAFPLTRVELYVTNVISGFVFMIIPQMLTFLASVIVCLAYGVTCVQYIGVWLLFMIGISVIAYAMAVFCCMLTGQLFAGAVYFGILNFFCPAVQFLFFAACSSIGSGIRISMNDFHYNVWLSPITCLTRKVRFEPAGRTDGMLPAGIEVYGADVLAWYMIPAVLFFVLAFLIYRRRRLEDAGSLVTVPFLKPVFRWGCGFMFGYAAGLTFTEVLFMVLPHYFLTLGVLLVVVGCICFFLAQMLLKKSFKVFSRRSVAECAVFALFLLASFGIMRGSIWMIAKKMPDIREIEYVCVDRSYPVWYSGDEIPEALNWHEQIIDNLEEIERLSQQDGYSGYGSLEFIYLLSDGSVINRQYPVPYGIEPYDSLNREIYRQECDAETFLNNYMIGASITYNNDGYAVYFTDHDYRKLEVIEGNLWFHNQNHTDDIDFKGTEAEALYQAVILDTLDGHLQKYNIVDEEGRWGAAYSAELYLEFKYMQEGQNWGSARTENVYHPVCLQFGPDCTNIIQALVDNGIIQSEEDLQQEEDEDE